MHFLSYLIQDATTLVQSGMQLCKYHTLYNSFILQGKREKKKKKPFSFNTGFNRYLAGDLDLVHKAVKQNIVKRVSRQ